MLAAEVREKDRVNRKARSIKTASEKNREVTVQRKSVSVKVVEVVGDLKNIFSVSQISHSDTRLS